MLERTRIPSREVRRKANGSAAHRPVQARRRPPNASRVRCTRERRRAVVTGTNPVDHRFPRNPRRHSPEVDYSQRWTSTREPDVEWRVAWNTGTGEIYAARCDEADLHELGIARTFARAETALQGWASHATGCSLPVSTEFCVSTGGRTMLASTQRSCRSEASMCRAGRKSRTAKSWSRTNIRPCRSA